jgi:hypothetical protein
MVMAIALLQFPSEDGEVKQWEGWVRDPFLGRQTMRW